MNNLTALNGGENVTLADGRTVFVRQIPVREMQAYLEAQEDEVKQVALCTKLAEADVTQLGREDHERLVNACEEVNADFFGRWLQRQQRRMERLMPGLLEKRLSAMSALPTGAPKSPSSAA